MVEERVTIRVESNIGEDGPLTVSDTLQQFSDAFVLLSAAIAEEEGGSAIDWHLVSLSKNSPATATAFAYSPDPSVPIAALVRRGKARFSDDFSALADGCVAEWIKGHVRAAKSLLNRNLNGIGRTIIDFENGMPRAVLVERVARASLKAIERCEENSDEPDRSRSEFGTIDAHVAEAKKWNGQPALYVKDRLSGRVFPCILSVSLAEKVGHTHSWIDAWYGQRVRIQGEIFYDKSGSISRMRAANLTDVNPSIVNLSEIRNIDILDGLSPTDHIRRVWGYADE